MKVLYLINIPKACVSFILSLYFLFHLFNVLLFLPLLLFLPFTTLLLGLLISFSFTSIFSLYNISSQKHPNPYIILFGCLGFFLVFGFWFLVFGFGFLVFGFWFLAFGTFHWWIFWIFYCLIYINIHLIKWNTVYINENFNGKEW